MAEFPTRMTPELEDVLGSPPWRLATIHRTLRACGVPIRQHYEEETAASLFFMIEMVLEHGSEWWPRMVERFDRGLAEAAHARAIERMAMEATGGQATP